jgi:porin
VTRRHGAGLAIAALFAAFPALAQTQNSSQGLQVSQPAAAPPPPPALVAPPDEHLFGDLGGLRSTLDNNGVAFDLSALTEFAGNVSGGVKQGSTFANQLGLNVDIDWGLMAGLAGLTTHAIFVNRSGASDSHLFGDNFLPVQEIFGSGGDVAVHLVSIYTEQSLFGGEFDVAMGRMNVENDFASSPLYCNFMNNMLCGDPKALPGGDIGHSAYPDAVWATRVRVRPIPAFYMTSGVYEVNQALYSDAFRTGFEFGTNHDSGVYLPTEAGYEPKFGADSLPGHYVIGFGYDTSIYQSFPIMVSATAATGTSRAGNTQFWALADQMLVRQGPDDADGIIALAGFIRNDPYNSTYFEQYFAGLVNRGFWTTRPDDAISVLFDYNSVSGVLARTQDEEGGFGLPFSNGSTGVQSHEIIVEVNYNIHVYRGLIFQPDFQYVFRPNAQANIPNAAVFGFRARVSF